MCPSSPVAWDVQTTVSDSSFVLQERSEKVSATSSGGGGHPAQDNADLPQSLLPRRLG